MAAKRIVTLFTKEECSLCSTAKYILQRVRNRVPFIYEEVDIAAEENKKWFDLYKYDIPVIHIDGKEVARHKFSERALRDALHANTNTDIDATNSSSKNKQDESK